MKEYKNSNELLDYLISKGVSVNNKEDTFKEHPFLVNKECEYAKIYKVVNI